MSSFDTVTRQEFEALAGELAEMKLARQREHSEQAKQQWHRTLRRAWIFTGVLFVIGVVLWTVQITLWICGGR